MAAPRAHLAHIAPRRRRTARCTSPAFRRNVARPFLDDGGFSPKFSAFLRKRVAFGEPNSKHVNSGGPTVNGFARARGRFMSARNPNFSKALAWFLAARQFSVQETACLGIGCNRQGCDRSPRFPASNSHILLLT